MEFGRRRMVFCDAVVKVSDGGVMWAVVEVVAVEEVEEAHSENVDSLDHRSRRSHVAGIVAVAV